VTFLGSQAVFLLEFSCVYYDPFVGLSMSAGAPLSEVYGEEEAPASQAATIRVCFCVVGFCCRFRLQCASVLEHDMVSQWRCQ
jgi:hypothetical protein